MDLNLPPPHLPPISLPSPSFQGGLGWICRVGVDLKCNMNPTPFIDQLRVRQMISDIRQPSRVHRYVNSSTLHVVTVVCTLDGVVEIPAAEPAVDLDGHAKVLTQRL